MENNMENRITGLGQLAISVSDVQKALAFYRDVLGLQFLFAPSENLAFVGCGVTRIMLTTPQGHGEAGKNSIPYFKVPDLESFFADALNRGAHIERKPQLIAKMPDHELWIGFLKDFDGNLVGLMEERVSDNAG
jgi:catechol 2,3-dioxygenase-like lactoylglutathione lyase family enzyme